MLTDLTTKEFIGKVEGSDPVPGGGSVSALCGALAAALGAMVANLTVGRKKYEEVNDLMVENSQKLSAAVKELIEDVDKDADAYNRVFEAFKLPKTTDEEMTLRREAIEEATKYAASIPMGVAKRVYEMLPLIESVAERGNSNAVTDACVAAMCARTAILGALLNVRINLSSIKDEEFVASMSQEADKLEWETTTFEGALLERIKEKI